MTNKSYSNRVLSLVFSPDFKVQSAIDVAILPADLTARQPQLTPTFHSLIPFREETRDCSGEFVTIERLTGKIGRFTFAMDFTAKLAAGWYAYLKGTTAAPTGTPADETQTINLGGATGGNVIFDFSLEGLSGVGGTLATGVATTAAQVQTALEACRAIKTGNVTVTGAAGGPFTVTFVNALAKANVPLITVDDDNSTGGSGVVVAAGTAGDNKHQLISDSGEETRPLFSLIEGFPDDDNPDAAKIYKNLVLNSWTLNIPPRGKPTLTLEAFGDPDPAVVPSFDWPDCVVQAPVRSSDCRLKIGSNWIGGDIREVVVTESNNIDVSEDALKFDDLGPDQLERGDRTASITTLVKGAPDQDLYDFAADADNAFDSVELYVGPAGERFAWFADNVQFRLDDGLVEFTGTRNKSAFRLIGRPSPDNTDVVTSGEYVGAYTGQFLQASV